MIDKSTRKQLAERKEQVRRRINTKVDPENYEFIPAKKPIDYYDNDIRQRVAVYARVSTDNVQQTSSYELQRNTMKILLCIIPTGHWSKSMRMRGSAGLLWLIGTSSTA